jgi:hypothetical protein
MSATFSFFCRLVVGALALAVSWAADAPVGRAPAVEFAAFHATEKSAWVILADRETKEVSSWMAVGQEWRGFRVTRIAEDGESVQVTKGAESWVVRLKQGRVTESKTAQPRGPSGFTLLRGEVRWEEGTWIYSEDAVVQFGEAVLSAITGAMEVEGDTIRGHLSLDAVDGRRIEADEATTRMIDGQSVLVAGRLGIKFSTRKADRR